MKKVLITGGAGYIGSITNNLLTELGYQTFVVDNLSTGSLKTVRKLKCKDFFKIDAGDIDAVSRVLKAYKIDSVIHFAGYIVVPESVSAPEKYYQNNVSTTINLLQACITSGVKNFIFSSTGSVYVDSLTPIKEAFQKCPTNPYSLSKLICESIIKDICSAHGINFGILRYFNVAGADNVNNLGQLSKVSTHLIKIASELAVGKRDEMSVRGTDYPTPDGTCVRDYIHVLDLADAHEKLLSYLLKGGASDTFNCGYGRGYSVLDVIGELENICGKRLNIKSGDRRAGDAVAWVSDCDKIKDKLGWKPKHDNLNKIITSAINWENYLLAIKPV